MKVWLPRRMISSKLSKKGASSLLNHIVHIVLVGSKLQVRRIAATLISHAGMQDIKASRNVFFMVRNPRDFVRLFNVVLHSVPKSELSVTNGKASHPVPAFIRPSFFNLRPESFLKFWRKNLREKFSGDRLGLHRSVRLICDTLSGEPTPRGHFYFTHAA